MIKLLLAFLGKKTSKQKKLELNRQLELEQSRAKAINDITSKIDSLEPYVNSMIERYGEPIDILRRWNMTYFQEHNVPSRYNLNRYFDYGDFVIFQNHIKIGEVIIPKDNIDCIAKTKKQSYAIWDGPMGSGLGGLSLCKPTYILVIYYLNEKDTYKTIRYKGETIEFGRYCKIEVDYDIKSKRFFDKNFFIKEFDEISSRESVNYIEKIKLYFQAIRNLHSPKEIASIVGMPEMIIRHYLKDIEHEEIVQRLQN